MHGLVLDQEQRATGSEAVVDDVRHRRAVGAVERSPEGHGGEATEVERG
jgi:hypothetical protein